jgi:hypothetical protein
MSASKLCSCKDLIHGEGGCGARVRSHHKDRLCDFCAIMHRGAK